MLLLAAPHDNENKYPPHPDPLPPRGEGKKINKKNEIVPSPWMGEGEDEGESPAGDPGWLL